MRFSLSSVRGRARERASFKKNRWIDNLKVFWAEQRAERKREERPVGCEANVTHDDATLCLVTLLLLLLHHLFLYTVHHPPYFPLSLSPSSLASVSLSFSLCVCLSFSSPHFTCLYIYSPLQKSSSGLHNVVVVLVYSKPWPVFKIKPALLDLESSTVLYYIIGRLLYVVYCDTVISSPCNDEAEAAAALVYKNKYNLPLLRASIYRGVWLWSKSSTMQ